MSHTYRAPPPRRRLRAGHVARLCWRCRYPVAACDCPARALVVQREQPEGDLSDEASGPCWRCDCGTWCECDSDFYEYDAPQGPLGQPLGLKLIDGASDRDAMIERYRRVTASMAEARLLIEQMEREETDSLEAFDLRADEPERSLWMALAHSTVAKTLGW